MYSCDISCLLVILGLGVLLIPLASILTRLCMKLCIKRCTSRVTMAGKVIIVTGGNTGIGYETAKNLAARGSRVILACRNANRAIEARDKIIKETGNGNIIYKQLNLSSLDSIRKFAEDMITTEKRLDVLINNAGVHGFGDRYTVDGIVEGMQINYFGPFLLTNLLLPLLKKSKGRIVVLSSICHFRGEVKLDRINNTDYCNGTETYANSKLCQVLFTVELAKKLKGTGVTVNSMHPGVILTNIVSDPDGTPWSTKILFTAWCWLCCRTAEEGAQTVIHLAVAKEVANVSGKYFMDCKERFMTWHAKNDKLCKDLWNFSKELVHFKE